MSDEGAAASDPFDTAQRLTLLATGNQQLLAVLELLHTPQFQDGEHLMDAAGDTQALVILAGAAEPTEALDPDGKVRERLRSCVAAAGRIREVLMKLEPGLKGTQARVSLGLNRLVRACEQLHGAVDAHDRPFDKELRPPDTAQS